ncbi:sn-glycerol-3-phosphate ABC transporter ATP-binding protein UgpC [Opitutaceae bacterium TAV4]|uniref:ABC transporter ATP-binding protein n=1 Tax=Geminisphaera colitermitum TaxID=1148786 RepID=UPI0005BAD367|nr:sn-glycerol-3-phosphate ABC transporter ATP-binding protein UgpC [Geminisphaera colitermitum]RRJ95402.1 sn-glycerol-3-phosphate ABC transporter ATP-binding protein UgpC [Opitutaceae bacterium TAV4]RRJ99950.1 sn-glycerol-3-phosphate ABC transporter ATP-binding protein UgpC [Opitutaceae bacterium TAV3]
MANVVIDKLVKIYPGSGGPDVKVVHGIDLEIKDREFMVLVGPSGCGKSTTLRMIAGLEEISGGTISIDGRVVNHVLPKDRDIAMVFQNYALYPHMTVYDNMAFGLKLRKMPKDEIDKRVREASAMLGLDPYLNRKPKALSGGQRQRVAVGRAIVRKPKVFLFDEPLSNLDAKMRVSTRTEISKLHARLGATMIYVTHDQVEAMTMGDRICVMKDGYIMQVAEPLALYNRPDNLFVAGFIGSPQMNFFKGTLRKEGNTLQFVEKNDTGKPVVLTLSQKLVEKAAAYAGKDVILGIRPEHVEDTTTVAKPDPSHTLEAKIEVSEPMGSETYLYLTTGATNFIARVHPTDQYDAGQQVKVTVKMEEAHLFDAATEKVIR